MSLAANKIAVIQVARQKLGLTEEDYRAILFNIGGVQSSRDLDDDSFDAVMFRFKELGFVSTWNRQNFGYRSGMATPRQVAKIRAMWNSFTDGTGTDESLGKWLEGRFKVTALRFIDAATARKAIGALSNMNTKKKSKAA